MDAGRPIAGPGRHHREPRNTDRSARGIARFGGALISAAVIFGACQGGGSNPAPTSAEAVVSATTAGGPSEPPAVPSVVPTVIASPGSSSGATLIDPRIDGLDVTFGEFAITLEASVIRPGRVTLVVHNAGHLTHGFEMKVEGRGSDGDRREIETRTFRSGETLRVEADLPPGTYEIECYVADHDERGMRTMLEVRDDAPLITVDAGSPTPGLARIVQFAFVPATIEVAGGSEVVWTNEDPAPHTVTADDGTFDSRQLDPDRTFSLVLSKPGDYSFHCEIHPTMTGVVHVR